MKHIVFTVTVDSTHPSPWSAVGEGPHKQSGWRDSIPASVRAVCLRKCLQGRPLSVVHDCHDKLLVNPGGDTPLDRSQSWENDSSPLPTHTISVQCLLLLKTSGKIWGNSSRRVWQQGAWTICHVVKDSKLCELCRDSSHCEVLCVFLSVQDGKKLQILYYEKPLASNHVISDL